LAEAIKQILRKIAKVFNVVCDIGDTLNVWSAVSASDGSDA